MRVGNNSYQPDTVGYKGCGFLEQNVMFIYLLLQRHGGILQSSVTLKITCQLVCIIWLHKL